MGDVPEEEMKCAQQPPIVAITACNVDSTAKQFSNCSLGSDMKALNTEILLSNSRLFVQVSFLVNRSF